MNINYLETTKKQFEYYKLLAEQTFEQLDDEQLFWQFNSESNSIATIVQHLAGNMISRWTDFLTTDGEKPNRNRDLEFLPTLQNRAAILQQWNKGWNCFFDTFNALTNNDLEKEIFIRNMGQTVLEAINRQLAHYPYHVGQIVFIGKMLLNQNWKSLSILKGNSEKYNENKFSASKQTKHFTDEYLSQPKI